MHSIHLKQASLSDIPEILRLFKHSIEALTDAFYDAAQRKAWVEKGLQAADKWKQRVEADYFLVAVRGGQLLGFASLVDGQYIDLMYVDPAAARQGVASRLYTAMEKNAIENGTSELTSDVSFAARSFFEYQGFKAQFVQMHNLGTTCLQNIRMIKSLSSKLK